MRALTTMAQELFDSVAPQLADRKRTVIAEHLECGEEGVAVEDILEWAIETGTPIDEALWEELTGFYQPLASSFSQDIRTKLATVPHAA